MVVGGTLKLSAGHHCTQECQENDAGIVEPYYLATVTETLLPSTVT
jgi:hypothetical protein